MSVLFNPTKKQCHFEDMAWLFSCDNQNRGLIRMNFDEAALLWKTTKATKGPILEIGRYQGGSTTLLAAASGKRLLYSIDSNPKAHAFTEAFLEHHKDRIYFINKKSQDVSIEFICGMGLIDGDHTYDGVRADIKKHWPTFQKITGEDPLIAFHDALPNKGLDYKNKPNHCSGVLRFCKELIQAGVAKIEATAGSLMVLRKLREIKSNGPSL